jgi:hypothetical protein
MGSYAILIPGQIAAKNTDSLIKIARCPASAVENGNLVLLGALSAAVGEKEVYIASTPITGSLATAHYYMVYEPAIPVVDGKYKGLSDDPSDFRVALDDVFTVFHPMVGDEVILSADGITSSVNTYVVAANAQYEMAFSSSAASNGMVWEVMETTFINVPNGSFYGGRKVAYKLRCLVSA